MDIQQPIRREVGVADSAAVPVGAVFSIFYNVYKCSYESSGAWCLNKNHSRIRFVDSPVVVRLILVVCGKRDGLTVFKSARNSLVNRGRRFILVYNASRNTQNLVCTRIYPSPSHNYLKETYRPYFRTFDSMKIRIPKEFILRIESPPPLKRNVLGKWETYFIENFHADFHCFIFEISKNV